MKHILSSIVMTFVTDCRILCPTILYFVTEIEMDCLRLKIRN